MHSMMSVLHRQDTEELATSAEAKPSNRRIEFGALAIILVVAVALRIWLLRFPGYDTDIGFFTAWTDTLTTSRLDEFYYRVSQQCDYLPGYLYILAATGWVRGLISGAGPFLDQDFEPWIKGGPILADLILGIVVFRLCRRFVGPRRSLLAASLVLFNPGVVFVSAVWGQVDSVASTLTMLSLFALLSGNPVAAAIWAGAAFVTKPHYSLFLVAAGVAYLRAELLCLSPSTSPIETTAPARRVLMRMVLPIAVLIVVIQLLLVPFSVSLWPSPYADWTLAQRLALAGDRFPVTSTGAFNIWGTQVAGLQIPDATQVWLSLSYQTWGFILMTMVVSGASILAWRRAGYLPAVLWSCFAVAFGFFEVLTRIHERYLFAAVPLIAILAVIRRWAIPFYLGVSALYFVNVWSVWAEYQGVIKEMPGLWASDLGAVLLIATLTVLVVLATSRGRPEMNVRSPAENLWYPKPPRGESQFWQLLSRSLTFVHLTLIPKTVYLVAVVAGVITLGVFPDKFAVPLVHPTWESTRTTVVKAYAPWQDTGVRVETGDRVSILARGWWSNQADGELFGASGTQEISGKAILPSAPTGVLLGRIADSMPFVVGQSTALTATTSGMIQLIMNDWPSGHFDNRGRLEAVITVLKQQ